MQYAARDKTTREDEEETGVAADALPEGQPDRRSGGRLRGGVQGLEDSLPMGGFLYGPFPPGMWGKDMRGVKSTSRAISRLVYRRDMWCKKSLVDGRFTEVPFLSQFSLPNDVPYDRDISVAISMDYSVYTTREYTSARQRLMLKDEKLLTPRE